MKWIKLVFFFSLIASARAGQGDWPQYRGQLGNGVAVEGRHVLSWPAAGPREVWRVPMGAGYGEMVVVDGAIYTNTGDEAPADGSAPPPTAREYLIRLDAATGKERWRHDIGPLLVTEFGNGARSTPTVDGDTVYVVSGTGILVACNTADGSERWRVDYKDAYKSEQPAWGFSSSAIVEGDTLIVVVGGADDQALVGLDKRTGAKKWANLGGRAGYATPVRTEVAGTRQMVLGLNRNAYGLGLDGKVLWQHEYGRFVPIAMPVFVAPDMFLFSSNDENLALMLRVTREGERFKAEELWRGNNFKNHFSSSVAKDGIVFGFDVATLKGIEAKTGTQLWARRGYGKGTLILAGDRLLILTDRGKLVVGVAERTGFNEEGAVQALNGRSWTAPTLVGTRLYLRNMTERVCYELAP